MQCTIANKLGNAPKDSPETYHFSFDIQPKAFFPCFRTPNDLLAKSSISQPHWLTRTLRRLHILNSFADQCLSATLSKTLTVLLVSRCSKENRTYWQIYFKAKNKRRKGKTTDEKLTLKKGINYSKNVIICTIKTKEDKNRIYWNKRSNTAYTKKTEILWTDMTYVENSSRKLKKMFRTRKIIIKLYPYIYVHLFIYIQSVKKKLYLFYYKLS